jgi:catechol 2,3-dioxygenase-like lactoylglutathione lyase family enzyme
VDHLGITVPDLSTAVELFTRYLGAELVYNGQPAFYNAEFTKRQFGISGDCSLHRALLRLGPTTNLEIMQFDGLVSSGSHPRNSDVGGHHLALAVEDVDRAAAYLADVEGIDTFGVRQEADGGEIKGDRWQYFRLPWGLYGEVLKMPHGVPFGRPHTADRFEYT